MQDLYRLSSKRNNNSFIIQVNSYIYEEIRITTTTQLM
jgi:hypothetical protein